MKATLVLYTKMLLYRAFELLRSESYTNFILTVGCIAVAIYCNGNMGFKMLEITPNILSLGRLCINL